MLRVAAYTGGRADPSSRFRLRQYLPKLADAGVEITDFEARFGRYPPARSWTRAVWALARVTEALAHAPASGRFDLVLFQRELLSTFITAERFYGRPRVMDVDDAIWLHRRGAFANKLAALSDAVICGNAYLADHFRKYCKQIFILPTAIDTARFVPVKSRSHAAQVIGWSGTSVNLGELQAIAPALRVVMQKFPASRLRVVCDRAPVLPELPRERIDYVSWSPECEVSALQDLRVGLMPLRDTAWTRGKCAFKMLTYMACGIPVVVSPVGMSGDVLKNREVGFGANSDDDWIGALSALLSDSTFAQRLGQHGRAAVEQSFSVDYLAPEFAAIVRGIAA